MLRDCLLNVSTGINSAYQRRRLTRRHYHRRRLLKLTGWKWSYYLYFQNISYAQNIHPVETDSLEPGGYYISVVNFEVRAWVNYGCWDYVASFSSFYEVHFLYELNLHTHLMAVKLTAQGRLSADMTLLYKPADFSPLRKGDLANIKLRFFSSG